MDIQVIGLTQRFDRDDLRNAGPTADGPTSPGSGGTMLRRGTHTDAKATTYRYLTHNLMLLLERGRDREGQRDQQRPGEKRKVEREGEARESGAGWVTTVMQRFKVRSVTVVRWLRNLIYREGPGATRSPAWPRSTRRGDPCFPHGCPTCKTIVIE